MNMRRFVLPWETDARTLFAAAHGFSSKKLPALRGARLDLLVETVVRSNGGKIDIFSGRGRGSIFMGQGTIRRLEVIGPGFCPGVTFDISLKTHSKERVEDEPEALGW
jgi:hypothetical protein